ncbi:UDP-glucose--hexose-1-phosphate uridylyltransferase [Virgibacillus dokdonensis]|uniref:UDP-glucose--hexose-1-phosphate uridylyltransferase n=1 Tax=Virgibacillus dokdonensis TaxID=302167 RepID=UPI00098ABB68|nr:UDP-glucose--hexose-1-phosphate uridylyltransferase [Virgibacillus dokdonensis]
MGYIDTLINKLIQQAVQKNLIEQLDTVYARNQIMALLKLESYHIPCNQDEQLTVNETIPDLLEQLIAWAVEAQIIENVFDDKEILTANIMNCFLDKPSTIHDTFYKKYAESPQAATDYFYQLSKHSNYIQVKRTQKNVHFTTQSTYGEIEITINLSKPEKDPEQIKREREWKHTTSYPKCVLCRENEGYVGRTGYPARANHRVIPIPLLDEVWYLQYSPYVYYNEHSILLSEEHHEMKIDQHTFARLLAFVERFPHYFIGSNADLPIVGGSILSHDHYQAGRHTFPMSHTQSICSFSIKGFSQVEAAILKWPLSVIRLQSRQKNELISCAAYVLDVWKSYTDEAAEIISVTNDIPHNTITPIARWRGNVYELDLVLRNNRTIEEHPTGISHPHKDVQHIKKENIGLIEVMGLAVLPARLETELGELKRFLYNQPNKLAGYHSDWAHEIKRAYSNAELELHAETIIQAEVGKKFIRALEDAGVFKQTETGIQAFKRFINELNQ